MKRFLATLLFMMLAPNAFASVGAIKVCDSKTLAASTTTDCAIVELPASRNFSYQVYCGETTGNGSMSVDVDFVAGSSSTVLAVPSGVSQLLSAYATEDAWSSIAPIDTPIATYGTLRFTEKNADPDIVCSAILNVGEATEMTQGTTIVYSSGFASINAAVAAIGATPTILIVDTPQTLTANLTTPATLDLRFGKGGYIIKASTYTLTINGPFEAGPYQVFSGFSAGNVTFSKNFIKELYAEWWQASMAANAEVAINQALASCTGVPLHLLAKTYVLGGDITAVVGRKVFGDGTWGSVSGTVLYPQAGTTAGITLGTYAVLSNLAITNVSRTEAIPGVFIHDSDRASLDHIYIYSITAGTGISVDGSNQIDMDHVFITTVGTGMYFTNSGTFAVRNSEIAVASVHAIHVAAAGSGNGLFENCYIESNTGTTTVNLENTTEGRSMIFDRCSFEANGGTNADPVEILRAAVTTYEATLIIKNCDFTRFLATTTGTGTHIKAATGHLVLENNTHIAGVATATTPLKFIDAAAGVFVTAIGNHWVNYYQNYATNYTAGQIAVATPSTFVSIGNSWFSSTTDNFEAAKIPLLINPPQSVTCTDNGSPSTLTITPSSSYIEVTNSDVEGCNLTLSETNVANGTRIELWVISNAGTTVNIVDSNGVQETAATINLALWQHATCRYAAATWMCQAN